MVEFSIVCLCVYAIPSFLPFAQFRIGSPECSLSHIVCCPSDFVSDRLFLE